MTARDHYHVLGVSASADPAELKRAYRRMQRSSHPDTGGSAERFRVVQEAWAVIGNPKRRAAYDSSIRSGARSAEAKHRARPAAPAAGARGTTRTEQERPRARRADSHGHPGGSARLLYLDLLRGWLINYPSPPTPPVAWAPATKKRGPFLHQWAKLCRRMIVVFATVGVVLFLILVWGQEVEGIAPLGLWGSLAFVAGISGASGALCSVPIGVMRMLQDPYRRELIRYRKKMALRYAAAQKEYRSARQAFEWNQRNRPANVTPLLESPYSDEAVAAAPAAARSWFEKARAQELTARALKPLGLDFSIWHDLQVGPKKTRIDHLVVGPQGLILIESMTASGPVTVEFGTLIHCGQAVPEVLSSMRPRLLAVATALGIGRVSAAILVYPDAFLADAQLQKLRGAPEPTFVIGASRLADALSAGLPDIETSTPRNIDRLRNSMGVETQFA
ncbi:DnaJ domain-containing protein [Cryobacterium sp. PH29-G1]|uniref:J domain-containing protein n=1 Tax=Cryobacterium sp. PH29-G1 TaxID=3046211 RepID=UPI0024BB49AB|nr:DnaJ domain-containing protein [Cryobacterium sp. PH29-G1]MDJ0349077.1 DnaJ domain-containing protein [Cryobacterium sp. PH29-G1]